VCTQVAGGFPVVADAGFLDLGDVGIAVSRPHRAPPDSRDHVAFSRCRARFR
jgi:hypothetical protein